MRTRNFDGNILKWQEFWDTFEAMIHKNTALQSVDKFNHLKIPTPFLCYNVVIKLLTPHFVLSRS